MRFFGNNNWRSCWVLLNGFQGGKKCKRIVLEWGKRDWFYVSTYLSPCILNAKCLPPFTPNHSYQTSQQLNKFYSWNDKKKGFIDFIMVLLPFFMCKDQYEQFYGFPLQIYTHAHTYTHFKSWNLYYFHHFLNIFYIYIYIWHFSTIVQI